MPYVSARYAPPTQIAGMAAPKEGAMPVIATDDQGVEWHLTEDSQVGDWLRYKESESFRILEADALEEEEPEPIPTKKPAPTKKKR